MNKTKHLNNTPEKHDLEMESRVHADRDGAIRAGNSSIQEIGFDAHIDDLSDVHWNEIEKIIEAL